MTISSVVCVALTGPNVLQYWRVAAVFMMLFVCEASKLRSYKRDFTRLQAVR